MTSATTGVALRLDGVPQERLVYLSMLPALLTQVGVIKDGKPISYEEMSEMLRKEILSLNGYFSTNFRTGRAELVVRGAGNDAAESQRALEWMKLVLNSPDWRPENLARIRDVVDQILSGMRNRMQGSEEIWVNDPADAYWRQDNPLLLSISSFLTQAHNVHRLRWMLKDAGADRDRIAAFLDSLAAAPKQSAEREHLKNLLGTFQRGRAERPLLQRPEGRVSRTPRGREGAGGRGGEGPRPAARRHPRRDARGRLGVSRPADAARPAHPARRGARGAERRAPEPFEDRRRAHLHDRLGRDAHTA